MPLVSVLAATLPSDCATSRHTQASVHSKPEMGSLIVQRKTALQPGDQNRATYLGI